MAGGVLNMMPQGGQTLFRYKTVKGHLHKLPPLLKLFMLLPLSVFCLYLLPVWLAAGSILAVFTAFLCKFTLQEQAADIKPAFFYAALMYALSIFSNLIEIFINFHLTPAVLLETQDFSAAILAPNFDYLKTAMRLLLMVQLCAIFFRTTSSLEIRESLLSIERFIRRLLSNTPIFGKWISQTPRYSHSVSLFLSSIPDIFSTWTALSLSWKARGGKKGIFQIKTLVFLLILKSFENAAVKAKALEARER